MNFRFHILTILFLAFASIGSAQVNANFRKKLLLIDSDSVYLDTLSIVPQSQIFRTKSGDFIPDSNYQFNYGNALLQFKKEYIGKTIEVSYRVLPLLLSKPYFHKSMDQIEQDDPGKYDFFTIKQEGTKDDIFLINGLNKNGSISRGINFGNNQDLAVNSNLDLQLSGRVTDDINIQAAISDNNLPIQADGNTQQLQEFDRVYIRLFNEQSQLIAGDFLVSRPESYFMNLNKKVQGGGFQTAVLLKEELDEKDNGILNTSINAAVSRGKFNRQIVPGQEGIQGPYQLRGAEGESFIIVLSGTERVYLNGRLMTRGQENDYVIDYNTSELTFTPNQIITKDMRIVVEFQYSERNYGRSLIYSENQYQKEKLKINFNVYSEQDNKNQPLQQELNEEERRLLAEVGDDLNNAVISGIDTSGFENDQVTYKLIDTLGFSDVLVYSKNPDSAIYRARFSVVGNNNGNYIQAQSDANGRVFRWVRPDSISGEPQGNYEPVIQLITPKQRQMVTLGADYQFAKNTLLSVEGAFSSYDQNTFSDRDRRDDNSYGMKLYFEHRQQLQERQDSVKPINWNTKVFYEQRGINFQFVERYRDVEFDRDWNIRDATFRGNQYLAKLQTGFSKGRSFFNYRFDSFIISDDYEGIRNGFDAAIKHKGFSFDSQGSYLTAEAEDNNEFLRHYTTISQKLGDFKVGGYLEEERIIIYEGKSDTIRGNGASFDRVIWRSFIELGDTLSENFYRLTYGEIYDYFPVVKDLDYSLKSENFDFDFSMNKMKRGRLNGKVTYRKLYVINDEITNEEPENTLLGRLEYDFKALKGFVSSNTFYQLGSGLEFRREFSFLEVNDGQGTHVWIDFNENGIKELNEFEVAGTNNAFRASYIRVFTPTNDFIRVFSNQFNQVLFLRPNALLRKSGKFGKFIGRFSNKAAYRAERKTTDEEEIFNPLLTAVDDSTLISVSSSFANTFYFNRIDPKYGLEFFYLDNRSKNLLTNGFEGRYILQRELRGRYNLNRVYSVESRFSNIERGNRSEFFSNRNYTIESNEVEPKLIYQPSVKFRVTLSAIYAEKENLLGDEASINRTAAAEMRFNDAGKGTFSLAANYINISYNSSENNSLSFEILEGLSVGNNITWTVLWQRNLTNNLQLNLNYSGRKSADLRIIHTGGMQVRAFF